MVGVQLKSVFSAFMMKIIMFMICFAFFELAALEEKSIAVVIPSYNNIKWYQKNLNSVFNQDYSNYHIYYADDCSNDGTGDAVDKFIEASGFKEKCTVIHNQRRLGSPLANHYNLIHNFCKDDDIVVCLDGDDWLKEDTQIFNRLNRIYSLEDVWLTHGNMIEYPHGSVGWSIPIPEHIVAQNAFREFRCAAHLKTFYAWLFNKIKIEDLLHQNDFYLATGDQALMFPMIEMAGERHRYIRDVIYVYNMSNPIGECIMHTQLQRDMEKEIRGKKRYKRLENRDDVP